MFGFSATTERDPLTIPQWRKVMMVITHSLAAFLVNYTAGAHLIAFMPMAATYEVTIAAIANTIGIGILGLGVGPLLWSPLSSARGLGRRGTYLLAWTCYVPLLLWLCFAKSFNSFAAARFVTCFFGAVAQSIPAQQIGETFDRRYKGTAMSCWALFMTMGPVSTAIVGAGLLEIDTRPDGWRSLYYLCAAFAAVMWVMIVLFVPETAYVPSSEIRRIVTSVGAEHMHSDTPRQSFAHGRHDNADKEKDAGSVKAETSSDSQAGVNTNYARQDRAWWVDIPTPFVKFLDAPVFLCAIAFALIFGWTVGMTILNPQVFFEPPYLFTAVQVGAVYMSALIGAVIGKLLGGYLVDISLLKWRERTGVIYPEQRLWALLAFSPIAVIGLLCYGFGIGNSMSWTVSIIPGQAFYYCFFNIISGVLQTYCVEIEPISGVHLISFLNFVKCAYAFSVPFYVPEWVLPIEPNAGHKFKTSFIIQMIVVLILVALVSVMALFLRHGSIPRRNGGKPMAPRYTFGL